MKQTLCILALLLAVATSPAQAADNLLKQTTQACVFGAAVLGIASTIVLYPAIVIGSSRMPAASLIIGNTVFGCGISAVGSAAAGIYGQLYDKFFPAANVMVESNASVVGKNSATTGSLAPNKSQVKP